jgi:hypothetical protein
LQPCGEVRRLADDRLLLRRALADQIADDNQPGGDPNPRVELRGCDIEAADGVDRAQPSPDRPLGIVFVRLRVTEINENGNRLCRADRGNGAASEGAARGLSRRRFE